MTVQICSGHVASGRISVRDSKDRGVVPVAYWIGLCVYAGNESFQTAAWRYNGSDMRGAGACFQPSPERWYLTGDGGDWVRRERVHAGTMRIIQPGLCAEVIAHEATHAALHIYRMGVAEQANLGDGHGEDVDFQREEDLCYLVGEITQKANDWLHTAGVWSD